MALLGALRRTKQIYADGTFKTVPNLFYQLFTLHLKAYKKVCIHNLFDWVQIINIFFLYLAISSSLRFNERENATPV